MSSALLVTHPIQHPLKLLHLPEVLLPPPVHLLPLLLQPSPGLASLLPPLPGREETEISTVQKILTKSKLANICAFNK